MMWHKHTGEKLISDSGEPASLCWTDLCGERMFLQEAETGWSAQVMNHETWMVEVQLLFYGEKWRIVLGFYLKKGKKAK